MDADYLSSLMALACDQPSDLEYAASEWIGTGTCRPFIKALACDNSIACTQTFWAAEPPRQSARLGRHCHCVGTWATSCSNLSQRLRVDETGISRPSSQYYAILTIRRHHQPETNRPLPAKSGMTGKGRSRWADSEEDAAREAALKNEKELKKRLKKEKEAARKTEEAAKQRNLREQQAATDEANDDGRPAKRRRVTPEPGSVAASRGGEATSFASSSAKLLRPKASGFSKARSVENYDKLNDIEEGAYGWVARAKELATGNVVALKRLKIEPNDRNGLPVTGLREIQILKDCAHMNIVKLQEVVVGDDTSKIEKYVPSARRQHHDFSSI